MEEVLSNQEARPGDTTQLMHAIFSSDDEMMSFYLTLNCFMNPESYLVERTDRKRLEDLANTLYSNVAAFEAIRTYKSISVKEVIRGFGAHMMNTQISNANRFQSADAVGTLMNCILNTTKNSWQFKKMDRNNDIHLQNVRYLLNRLDAAESNEEKNREEVVI